MSEKICKQEGCGRTNVLARGYCPGHYSRFMNGLDMEPPLRPRTPQPAEHFWGHVDKGAGCWEWLGYRLPSGYGRSPRIEGCGGEKYAHRIAYLLAVGEVPSGQFVDHACYNRACVNPSHLRLLDAAESAQNKDGATSRSKTGVRGVYESSERPGFYYAQATVRAKKFHLGTYRTIEEADRVVTAFRREHMASSVHDQKEITV